MALPLRHLLKNSPSARTAQAASKPSKTRHHTLVAPSAVSTSSSSTSCGITVSGVDVCCSRTVTAVFSSLIEAVFSEGGAGSEVLGTGFTVTVGAAVGVGIGSRLGAGGGSVGASVGRGVGASVGRGAGASAEVGVDLGVGSGGTGVGAGVPVEVGVAGVGGSAVAGGRRWCGGCRRNGRVDCLRNGAGRFTVFWGSRIPCFRDLGRSGLSRHRGRSGCGRGGRSSSGHELLRRRWPPQTLLRQRP